MLERMGYSVLEARNGQEAIDVIKTFDGDIDLAMLDILMSGISGETISLETSTFDNIVIQTQNRSSPKS